MKKIIAILAFSTSLLLSCAHPKTPTESNPPPSVPLAEEKELSMSREEIYKRLLSIANQSNQKIESKGEFIVSLPTDFPAGDQKKEWHSSYVTVFTNKKNEVSQLAVVTMTCNAKSDLKHQTEIQNRTIKLTKLVSEKVFGTKFSFDENYFNQLGSNWRANTQVTIKESFAKTKVMRLSRGIYKCDSHGGFGFRYDFILNN